MEDIIEIEGIKYFRKAGDSIKDADFINRRLNKLRAFLEDTCPRRFLNNINYDLYFYESEKLDAMAIPNKDGNIIAFSTATFTIIYETIKSIFTKSDILSLFKIAPKDFHTIEYSVHAIFDYMTYFITLHELFHLVNGHTAYLNSKGLNCAERWVKYDEAQTLESQILESNADISAARILARYVFLISYNELGEKKDRETMLPVFSLEIKFLHFSIYNLFLLFSKEYDDGLKDCINNMLVYDHPFPSLRMIYTSTVLSAELSRFLKDDEEIILFDDILKTCVAYDRIYYAEGNFEKSLQALGYTRAGAEHMLRLNNGWNNLVDKLEPYSYFKLERNEVLDEMPYWVNDKGKMQIDMKWTNSSEG